MSISASTAVLIAATAMSGAQPMTVAAAARSDPPSVARGAAVSDDARREYARSWASLPEEKAVALERRLQEIERRAAHGEDVAPQVELLRQQEPVPARLGTDVSPRPARPGAIASGNDVQDRAVCSGIGWIGRDGQSRCAGKYVIRRMVGRSK